MQPNCATWCQCWQQMLESEDRLSGASRQRFQPVGDETSSWRWNMWFGSDWGGGATFVGVRRCDIKRWDNAPASTVKSRDPLYWYWYEYIFKIWQSKQCYPKLSIQIEKQRSTVYEKFHCANSTRLLNILSRSFSKYHIWRIVFVAFVKVKSLLKVNTRKALRSFLKCTFILENEKSFSWVLPKYSTSCGEIHFERASQNNKSFWWIKFSFELYARCFVMQGYVNWLLLCNLEEFIAYKNDKIIVSQYFQYLATSAPCLQLLLRQRLEARRNVSSELMRSYLLWFRHHSSENQNYS